MQLQAPHGCYVPRRLPENPMGGCGDTALPRENRPSGRAKVEEDEEDKRKVRGQNQTKDWKEKENEEVKAESGKRATLYCNCVGAAGVASPGQCRDRHLPQRSSGERERQSKKEWEECIKIREKAYEYESARGWPPP